MESISNNKCVRMCIEGKIYQKEEWWRTAIAISVSESLTSKSYTFSLYWEVGTKYGTPPNSTNFVLPHIPGAARSNGEFVRSGQSTTSHEETLKFVASDFAITLAKSDKSGANKGAL